MRRLLILTGTRPLGTTSPTPLAQSVGVFMGVNRDCTKEVRVTRATNAWLCRQALVTRSSPKPPDALLALGKLGLRLVDKKMGGVVRELAPNRSRSQSARHTSQVDPCAPVPPLRSTAVMRATRGGPRSARNVFRTGRQHVAGRGMKPIGILCDTTLAKPKQPVPNLGYSPRHASVHSARLRVTGSIRARLDCHGYRSIESRLRYQPNTRAGSPALLRVIECVSYAGSTRKNLCSFS